MAKNKVKKLNPKGKTMGQISKEVSSKKTPKSVKVVEGDSLKKLRKNVDSYYTTVKAKSGATAKEKAAEVKRENKKSKTPKTVIKIRSGGAGLGGMLNVKNR